MNFQPLLFVSATPFELRPLYNALNFKRVAAGAFDLFYASDKNIFLLHTGIAKVNTAYALTRALSTLEVGAVLQCGIGGSFTPTIAIGDVVLASSEIDMDVGIRYTNDWERLEALNFSLVNEYYNKLPVDTALSDYLAKHLQLVKIPFATSDAITGDATYALQQQCKSQADIESMEGSAAAQVCLHFNTPFAEMRSVSNYVGIRDKTQWNIPLAIENLNRYALRLVDMLD